MKELSQFLYDWFWPIVVFVSALFFFFCMKGTTSIEFGPTSRCPLKKRIKIKDGLQFLILSMGDTELAYVHGVVRDSGKSVGGLEDLNILLEHHKLHESLWENCAILAVQGDDIYVLVTQERIGSHIRKIDRQSSYEDYMVLIKDTATVTTRSGPITSGSVA